MDEQREADPRVVVVLALVAVCLATVVMAWPRRDGPDLSISPLRHDYPDAQLGSAFDPRDSGGDWGIPLPQDDRAQISDVRLVNRTSQSVHVLAAAPVWQSEPNLVSALQLSPMGPEVMGSRTHVGTLDAPGPDRLVGVPLTASVSVPPSRSEDDGMVLSFDVAPPTSAVGGVLGLDIVYELGGRRWLQRFPFAVVVCHFPGTRHDQIYGPCGTYRGVDLFRLPFEDALAAVRELDG